MADFTLPYNPFYLLGRTNWTYEFEYYKNGKDQLMGVDDTAPYFFRVSQDDQKTAWNGDYESDSDNPYKILGTTSTVLLTDSADCIGDGLRMTTEKIVSNEEISQQPIFLFSGETFYSDRDCDVTYQDRGYAAFYFDAPKTGKHEIVDPVSGKYGKQNFYSSDSTAGVNINEENNDYYEGLFKEDLNGDGVIPPFLPGLPSYTPELQENGGKTINGTKKNDEIEGTGKNDAIYGKKGNDKLDGGKKGDDLLFGGPGQDELITRKGDDFLNGGDGNDILTGGQGKDVFKLSKGVDTITDFGKGATSYREKIAVNSEYIDDIEILAGGTGSIIAISNYGSLIISDVSPDVFEDQFAKIFVRYID